MPLFRRIDRHDRVLDDGDSGRLRGQAITLILRRAAARARLPHADEISGHSLRRGFATEARRAGHDLTAIGRHGGWADGSPVLLRYFEEVDRWAESPVVGLGL